MHQALLIDEILEVILDSCTESWTLSRIARTCQAWKDPALDRVWWRISSFKPLLDLIPGLLCVNGVYVLELPFCPDFRRLHCYASRVKQIVYRENIRLHPTLLSLLLQEYGQTCIFRKLSIVQLSLTKCSSLSPIISLAKGLKTVELDLGFKTNTFETANRAAFDFLTTADRVSSCFDSLSLRGGASGQVMDSVNNLSRLKVLHLCVGATLPVETLTAISTFPYLRELEIHTSHIQPEDFILSSQGCFPSLHSLNIRGRANSIEKLLQNMRSGNLVALRIDIEPLVYTNNTWGGLFAAIKEKTYDSLLQLTIEHHMDTQDFSLENDTPSSPDNTLHPYVNNLLRTNPNDFLHFEHLHSLSHHRNLRQIVIETTPPILVRDSDLEQIVRWWPNLEHLDLGSVPTFDPRWMPKATLAGLSILSRGLSVLDTLTIPINSARFTYDAAMKFAGNGNGSLRYMTLTASTPPDKSMAHYLHRLFPSIIEIHGTSGHEEHWDRVQKDFELLKLTE
ncbi:hypothetical protein GGU11DRAFT_512537 [Lentinula aff. detonsa]|nr:hypothetical protein GGU11DRAFT_512537 [Lentinula aff. detonsa]